MIRKEKRWERLAPVCWNGEGNEWAPGAWGGTPFAEGNTSGGSTGKEFCPFAPSIPEEAIDEDFVDASPDPFMQQVYPGREEKQGEIPTVTPVDGTGRLPAVGTDRNPAYHTLISAVAEKTGMPVVLTTSVNENEPIVESPEQALDCFFRTAMDAVVVENTLVQRQPVEAAAAGAPSD